MSTDGSTGCSYGCDCSCTENQKGLSCQELIEKPGFVYRLCGHTIPDTPLPVGNIIRRRELTWLRVDMNCKMHLLTHSANVGDPGCQAMTLAHNTVKDLASK